MQDRGVRQRLHRGYKDESREIEIGNVDLAAMGLEISAKQRASVSHHGVGVLATRDARNFFVEDAVKLGIDAVSVEPGRNEFAHRDLDRARGDPEKGVAANLRQILGVPLNDGRHQRFLAGEVLIERADADAGCCRDSVGARSVIAFLDQNASSCFDERIDGRA